MKAIPGKWIAYGLVMPITVAGAIVLLWRGEVLLAFGQVGLGSLLMAGLSFFELPIGKQGGAE